jgi:hypothetical protein
MALSTRFSRPTAEVFERGICRISIGMGGTSRSSSKHQAEGRRLINESKPIKFSAANLRRPRKDFF